MALQPVVDALRDVVICPKRDAAGTGFRPFKHPVMLGEQLTFLTGARIFAA